MKKNMNYFFMQLFLEIDILRCFRDGPLEWPSLLIPIFRDRHPNAIVSINQ